MAVAETAASQCKSASGESSGSSGAGLVKSVFNLTIGASLVFLCGLLSPHAEAQIVADHSAPGNQQPTILQTASGLPQVNIQTPSAAGVSRNTYSQFDVGAKGVILNNSRTDTSSQIGGLVQANPWLATGIARVILNEVNSANPSQIKGYVEVAGQRAEVSDDQQYQALMNSGLTFAKAQNLRPGIALSAAQVANLTTDIVWLQQESVTLSTITSNQSNNFNAGNADNHFLSSNSKVLGTTIQSAGNTALAAGNSLSATAASVNAAGDLSVSAQNIALLAGTSKASSDSVMAGPW